MDEMFKLGNCTAHDDTFLPPRTAASPLVWISVHALYQFVQQAQNRSQMETSLIDRSVDGRTLLALLWRKMLRRLRLSGDQITPVISYQGLLVFDTPLLDGDGMSIEREYLRVFRELGIRHCKHLFEFCAGPGYIGHALLANGICDRLTLADVNPLAVEAMRRTNVYNGLKDRVSVFESDCLDQIPDSERWDLVVGNPPHFLPDNPQDDSLILFDADWSLHRRFYAAVGRHMTPGGLVVLVENASQSKATTFEPMIVAGGGQLVSSINGVDYTGVESNGYYYVVSRW